MPRKVHYGPRSAKADASAAAVPIPSTVEASQGARAALSDILTGDEASEYLWARYRLQRSARRLGQLRAGPAGSGPAFHRAGNVALYKRSDVDAWAAEELGEAYTSTSDEHAHYVKQR